MFEKYWVVYYEDLLYTLEKENISIEKYQEMKNKGVKIYLLYNYRIFKCKKRDLTKKVNEFFEKEIEKGNSVKTVALYRIHKEYAQELARKNRTPHDDVIDTIAYGEKAINNKENK